MLPIALILLFVGLVVTIGIGSSFGTIPILAALYVPICLAAGFSPLATAALIGTAGALGDAGSPASDSTLGPTSGLNADGKHHHIWDTVVCVPKCSIWSPMPIVKRRINQNHKDSHTGNIASDRMTSRPPIKIMRITQRG